MLKNSRHEEIIRILEEQNYASVEKLAKLTFSSLPTIRRDLQYLSEVGYITRKHGGASLPEYRTSSAPFSKRYPDAQLQKKLICKELAKCIRDDMLIFLDASSTLTFLVPYLKKFKGLKIVTNSLPICNHLTNYSIPHYSTGGLLSNRDSYSGCYAERFVRSFRADLCFFSSTAITSDGIMFDADETATAICCAMQEHAKRRIYVCDESKTTKEGAYYRADTHTVDKIYTTANKEFFTCDLDKFVFIDWKSQIKQ